MSNLKPAPLFLNEGTVAKLVGDRPAYGKGVIHVPIEPFTRCDTCDQMRTTACRYAACPLARAQS